jgi:murein L,D-transpeptidase YafK
LSSVLSRQAALLQSFVRALITYCLGFLLFAPAQYAAQAGDTSAKADFVVVEKKNRTLKLYSGEKLIKEYRIALGGNPNGHKQEQGDRRTPEGDYVIDYRNPDSRFFRSLHISYPNERDRESARERGVSPGGDIFIHGLGPQFSFLGKFHYLRDWTDGCIAVTNEEIQEIWDLTPNGTRIRILP